MANDFGSNPIYLDTFSAAIDIGDTMFGDTQAKFKLNSIEWVGSNQGETALIKDGDGNPIFKEAYGSGYKPIVYFFGQIVSGITIAIAGVTGGQILIRYF